MRYLADLWLAIAPFLAGIVGFALGRWTTPRNQIGDGEADPSEYGSFWRGES